MLNELGPWLTEEKARDLLNRLSHRDPDQALPAEYELAISWGISKVATLEIDRIAGRKTPDIWSDDLLRYGPIAADVAAISDDPFSGLPLMRRAANILSAEASRTIKGAHRHLHYRFNEESGYVASGRGWFAPSQYFRRRLITKDFVLDDTISRMLKIWLSSGAPTKTIRIKNSNIDVILTWKENVHPTSNVFSSMPSVVYHETDNALYDVLKRKAKQLRAAPPEYKKVIFLGDAGCALLRNLNPIGQFREISGQQIIRRFLADSHIDAVIVFTPKNLNEYNPLSYNNPRRWEVTVFDNRPEGVSPDYGRLNSLLEHLPTPYLHGYQARSWHEQGMFNPQNKGHYLPTCWTIGGGRTEMKISARALQEFLAGRLTRPEFARFTDDDSNFFEANLKSGRTISSATFERGGDTDDDDYIVFEFSDDPAASPIKLPPLPKR